MRRRAFLLTVSAIVALAAAPALARDVTLTNTSKWHIHRIFVSPCGGEYWGRNRLAADEILKIGGTKALAIEGSCSDVKIVDEDGDVCVTPVHDEGELALTTKFLIDCQNRP